MIFAIDPASWNIGWALIDGEFSKKCSGSINLKQTNLNKTCIEARLNEIFSRLLDVANKYKEEIDYIVIETPDKYLRYSADSYRKLCFSIGALSVIPISLGKNFSFIDVNEWKGKKSKELTKLHLKNLKIDFKTEDEADAIDLGLWYFRNRKFLNAAAKNRQNNFRSKKKK